MRRIVSIWLAAWPIERLIRATPAGASRDLLREAPLALVMPAAGGIRISALNACALAEGVRVGTALADARAALPSLAARPAEPARDRAALVALARWAGRYGPLRHTDGDDGVWIDTTGVAHLYGGEQRLAGDIYRQLARLGISARIALAETLGSAHALARFATTPAQPLVCVPEGQIAQALAPLPLAALRVEPETVLAAYRLGLKRIGQLFDLPRTSLARRFRSQKRAAALLERLDAALGREGEPRAGLAEPPCLAVSKSFAEPLISASGLTEAVAELTHELACHLDAQGLGLRRGRLMLQRADASSAEIRIGTAAAVREEDHLLALLAHQLESIDAGFGIDALHLEAVAVEPLAARQAALTAAGRNAGVAGVTASPAEQRTAIVRLADRLANRLGADCVTAMACTPEHLPERAHMRWPLLRERQRPRPHGAPATNRIAAAAVPNQAPQASHLLASRPPLLLQAAEPIEVLAEVPDGPPLRFTWRRLEHRVIAAEGPERIEAAWWRALGERSRRKGSPPQESPCDRALGVLQKPLSRHRPRDYYRVEDAAGGRYWVYREGLYGRVEEEGPPCWFLHGVFA